MAEVAILSAVIQSLSSLLFERTISFVTSFTDVYEQFERLRKELISIQGFLNTVDSNHTQDPDIIVWIAEVREIAYDVEDVIDAFLLCNVAYKKEGESSSKKIVHWPKKIFNSYKLAKEMEKIFSKVKDISERRKRNKGFRTQQNVYFTTTNTRREYSHTKNDITIGLEDQTNELVSELLKEEDQLCVVSIIGMGGLGKTTLGKEVYNHRNVRSHFDCYAWTAISQQMNTREVLKEILRKVVGTQAEANVNIKDMNEAELVWELSQLLETKRYLIFLDDMWNKKDWDILKPAFPNSKGSKVMLSTRNEEVAIHADPRSRHFKPRYLTNDEAWELLCKRALLLPVVINSSMPLSGDLEECGREMVKKCGGLPLAITVLGGVLLELERSLDVWESVSKKIGIYLRRGDENKNKFFPIISLSYDELPYHLKPLFLYLGLFPEDSNIPVKKLVRMWTVERLIKEQEGETIEAVGRQYLDQLMHRCMVQIGDKSIRGGAKTCQLHDMMRELCIDIAKKENFFQVIRHQNSDPSSSSPCSKLRRCAIYFDEKGKRYTFPEHLTPCLRTTFFIPKKASIYTLDMVYKDFKFLKVLEFQGRLDLQMELFKVIRKLSNLRYLCVTEYIDVSKLNFGNFIGNLVFLETIDFREGYIDSGMSNLMSNVMNQLRHLYGGHIKLSKINKMTKLQTLCGVVAGPWITDVVKLTNLEKLGIEDLNKGTIEMLTMAMGSGGLDKVRSLVLKVDHDDEFSSDLLEALSGKRCLQKLKLLGRIKKLPSRLPPNLIKLNLEFTYLSEDPMATLEKLQHLLFLGLSWRSYDDGKQMVCSAKGFPKLRHLKILGLYGLEWIVEKGAMPCLTTCEINSCVMKMVPQGFKFLTLQELTIARMPESFKERVKNGGEDWHTIQHIPFITL